MRRLDETARDVQYFCDSYCPDARLRLSPDASPIRGDLAGAPYTLIFEPLTVKSASHSLNHNPETFKSQISNPKHRSETLNPKP